MTVRVSNMKAMVPSRYAGWLVSARLALSTVAASGPWPLMQLCSEAPPGKKPPSLASYLGQGAGQCLGGKLVAKSGLITKHHGRS